MLTASSPTSPPAIRPAAGCVQLPRPVRADPPPEGSGILLRQHPFHESLSEDRGSLLQRYPFTLFHHCVPVSYCRSLRGEAVGDMGFTFIFASFSEAA